MRLTPHLVALALLATVPPASAAAQEERPAPPRPPPVRPAPDASRQPRGYPRPAPPPVARPYPPPRHFHSHQRFWWGWGWGWYPLYARPAPPPPAGEYVPQQPPPEAERVHARFSLYGAGQPDGYVGGLDFGIEGRYTGFDMDLNAIARESVTGDLHGTGSDPATWASAHFTWSFLSERSFRLRLQTGLSMLSLPESAAVSDEEWQGKTIFGPDLGVSGHLGLLGPLGLEGHARVTPFPVRVGDVHLALAVHGGPLGLSAGWRWIHVEGDGADAPDLSFSGPQLGLALRF